MLVLTVRSAVDVENRWVLPSRHVARRLDDEPVHLGSGRLSVILVVGVNGSGKTTTIGKLAGRLAGEGRSVTIAGADKS